MPPIKVLIVDDSLVARRVLVEALTSAPEVQVVGTCSDGHSALARMAKLRPDVVTLDVEMPGLDGLETLAEIRKRHPEVRVIMVSSLSARAVRTTFEAFALGAVDCVAKPSADGSSAAMREQLVAKIRALFPVAERSTRPPATARTMPGYAAPGGVGAGEVVDVVTIAASTGGPNALVALLRALPAPLRVPILIVQHMPPVFTLQLAGRLATQTGMNVAEAVEGEALVPGVVRIAPGDFHMTVRRDGMHVRLGLNHDAQVNSCRPAADVLFRSVAEVYGPHALAVVLTGMGQDGLRGCQLLRDAGAQVLAQDEASSVVWGMPGFVVRAGLAHAVVPLDEMANEIMQRLRRAGGPSGREVSP
jgi:two-component system chemotaxis response regulator CheB